MGKSARKKLKDAASLQANLEVGRGEIQDNALKAIVTSQLFKTRVEKSKKGRELFS